jgi:hypothetical protein
MIHHNHGSNVNVAHVVLTRFITAMGVTSTLPMWYLQDSSQPWYRHQCRPCGTYKIHNSHGSDVNIAHVVLTRFITTMVSTSMSYMWFLQDSCQPWLNRLNKVGHAGLTSIITTMAQQPIKPNMWSLRNSSQPWLDRLVKVSYVEPMHSQTIT